jgi:phospholipid/cholesterol/gamma-HCH transport system permease protein
MIFVTNFLTRRGAALLATWRIWRDTLLFAARAIVTAATPAAYNSATRTVVMKQIYFTVVQILPGFTLFAALLSYVLIQIVVTTAASYGLSEYALEVSMRLLVLELLPLITALFVALRSSSAINTEIALMKINGELMALESAGVDTMRLEFMPRVIGGMISVLADRLYQRDRAGARLSGGLWLANLEPARFQSDHGQCVRERWF